MYLSLETSKKLDQMGVELDRKTEFYWNNGYLRHKDEEYLEFTDQCSAFLLSDLPEVLKQIALKKDLNTLWAEMEFIGLCREFYRKGWQEMEKQLLTILE